MDIIIFFSKYIFLFFIVLFCVSSVITGLEEKGKFFINSKNPSILIVSVFHILASFILVVNDDFTIDYSALKYCALVFLLIMFFKAVMFIFYKNADYLIINIVLFLIDLSLLFLFRLERDDAHKQLIYAFLSTFCIIIIPFLFNVFNALYIKFKYLDFIFIFLIFSLLSLPYFFGVETYGAKNWVIIESLNNFSFQPSEFVKIIFIFYLSVAFSRAKNFKGLILPTVVSFLAILMLVSQVDFGGSLIFFTIYLTLLYATTSSEILLSLGVFSLSFVSVLAYRFVPHVKVRVDIFLDPFQDPFHKGFQILQSLFAIGTYAPFGSGFTRGYPSFVPVVASDFIFSGISEEFGALFGIFLIVLIFILFTRCIKISSVSNEKYLILLSLGICVSLFFQAFLIIGGDILLIPLTGVTLPFVSYGGTSLFVSIVMLAILLKIDIFNYVSDAPLKPYILTRSNVQKTYVFYTIIYLALFASLFKFTFFESEKIVSSSHNPRVSKPNYQYIRGDILDINGKTLATSDENGNRTYPYGRIFSHVVGANTNGKTGIELSYNFTLDKAENELLSMTKSLITSEKGKGQSIKTTLNTDLQEYIYERLGQNKGCVIVEEASTGRILAMVSYPNFSPRTYEADFSALSEDKENNPLINRATQGLYPPASVFKIVSTLDIIHNFEGYENYTYVCNGRTEIDGEVVTCNNNEQHGEVDLQEAFTHSCNSFFASALYEMEKENPGGLKQEAEQLLFNEKVPFSLPLSKSTFTMENGATTGEIMHTAIGQGNTLTTPLELSIIGQTIANGGVTMKPYVVDGILNEKGDYAKRYVPDDIGRLMSLEDSQTLTEYMMSVVENGTARNAKLNGVTSAGKTGTAEVLGKKSHGLYLAFAPAENPEIVVTVVLENSGGSSATLPIARDVMNYYFSNIK